MSTKIFLTLVISSFLYSNIISKKVEEVEYKLSVHTLDRLESKIDIKVNRIKGITAEYQEFHHELFNTVDNKERKKNKLKKYEIKCEDIGISSIDDLFKVIDKIEFPEKTNHINRMIADAPIWSIIVDGKKYYGNSSSPSFYKEIMENAKFIDIMEFCIEHY